MHKDHAETWEDKIIVDFSAESQSKDKIKESLLKQLKEPKSTEPEEKKEIKTMKSTKRRGILVAIAACLSIAVVSAGAYAVYNYIKLGDHAQYVEYNPNEKDIDMSIPEELKGKLFDKDGNAIDSFDQIEDKVFNADGESVMISGKVMGDDDVEYKIMTEAEAREEQNSDSTLFTSKEEIKPMLYFDMLDIGYSPEGYTLEGYRLFHDNDGKAALKDNKYVSMYYYNGDMSKYIYVQIRYMDEETAFAGGLTDDMKKTSINGYEAIVSSDSIDLLVGDVMYMIMGGNSEVSIDELTKMAESIS